MSDERRGVVAIIRRDEQLLVIQRSSLVIAPYAYCFPGGGIEAGESEEMALRRELQEELGVTIEPLRCVWRSRTVSNVALGWWTARLVCPDMPLCPAPSEVAAVEWLAIPAILALPNLLESNQQFLTAVLAGEILL